MGEDRIVQDPKILVGKPIIKGTRISVALVLQHLGESLNVSDVLAAFPRLSLEDVQACVEYAERLVEAVPTPTTTEGPHAGKKSDLMKFAGVLRGPEGERLLEYFRNAHAEAIPSPTVTL